MYIDFPFNKKPTKETANEQTVEYKLLLALSKIIRNIGVPESSSMASKEHEVINNKPRTFNKIRIASLSGGPVIKQKEEKEKIRDQNDQKNHQESPLDGPQNRTNEQGRFNELIQEHVRNI